MKEIGTEVKKPIQGLGFNKAMENLLRRVFELMLAAGALSQSESKRRASVWKPIKDQWWEIKQGLAKSQDWLKKLSWDFVLFSQKSLELIW